MNRSLEAFVKRQKEVQEPDTVSAVLFLRQCGAKPSP